MMAASHALLVQFTMWGRALTAGYLDELYAMGSSYTPHCTGKRDCSWDDCVCIAALLRNID